MTDLFHVAQATADRWRADGRFVLFGEGERCPELGCDRYSPHTHPPAAMIEAAKPCDNCVGTGVLFFPLSQLHVACPDCSNGQRRHPVTVPCCTNHAACSDPSRPHCAWRDDSTADGRISTGLLAVVEFGPLAVVGRLNTDWNIGEHIFQADWRRWIPSKNGPHPVGDPLALPPDVDPASLVGLYACGGSIEVTS